MTALSRANSIPHLLNWNPSGVELQAYTTEKLSPRWQWRHKSRPFYAFVTLQITLAGLRNTEEEGSDSATMNQRWSVDWLDQQGSSHGSWHSLNALKAFVVKKFKRIECQRASACFEAKLQRKHHANSESHGGWGKWSAKRCSRRYPHLI
jgi:hypothetical protein